MAAGMELESIFQGSSFSCRHGYSVDQIEQKKMLKHSHAVSRLGAAYTFIPAGAETFGVLGKGFQRLVQSMATTAARLGVSLPRPRRVPTLHFLSSAVGVLIQRGNAALLTKALRLITNTAVAARAQGSFAAMVLPQSVV
jgi:hypothetical protein